MDFLLPFRIRNLPKILQNLDLKNLKFPMREDLGLPFNLTNTRGKTCNRRENLRTKGMFLIAIFNLKAKLLDLAWTSTSHGVCCLSLSLSCSANISGSRNTETQRPMPQMAHKLAVAFCILFV